MTIDVRATATTLDEAARLARAVPQLRGGGSFGAREAYDVQEASIGLRVARGERIIGMKMGFTSRAKMVQMGVSDMIWGRLTDRMLVEDGGTIELASYVHPRVEPEIAFLLGRPLRGDVTAMQAMGAIEAIAPALEIIDSRYEDFKFSLTDVIADNSSSSSFVVGAWSRVWADLDNLGMVMGFNGRPEAFGSSSAILGHPLRSLVAAARLSEANGGGPLQAGWVVMAGAATAAVALAPSTHVLLEVERLGRVEFTVSD